MACRYNNSSLRGGRDRIGVGRRESPISLKNLGMRSSRSKRRC